jgi:MprA protease rhombosortase-interaction domain-containing protein
MHMPRTNPSPAIAVGVLLPIALAMFALGHVVLGLLVVSVELLFVGLMGFALRRR